MTSSTPLSLPQLPAPIAKILNSFLQSAKDAFGSDLISVVLFGSAAEGKLRATSDLNLILVLGPLRSYAADLLDLEGRPSASSSQALETVGAELAMPDWTRLLARLSATQESRLSSLGEAPLLFSPLLDLACRMHSRAEALSGDVRREPL